MENCKIFIVRHAYKYAHYHSYIRRDINATSLLAFTAEQGSEGSFFSRRKFMPETLEAVHDDDCDIKMKINSMPSANTFALRNLNARSRFFKFTPCEIKIYDRKGKREEMRGWRQLTYATAPDGGGRIQCGWWKGIKTFISRGYMEKVGSGEKLIKYVI